MAHKQKTGSLTGRRGITRRQAIKALGTGAAAAMGAGAGLFGGKAPAFAQGQTLHVLQLSSFVPATDAALNKLAADFGKAQGVTLRMEYITLNDVLPRAVAAVESGTGPDVILLQYNQAQLFGKSFVDVGDVVQKVGGNKIYKFMREGATVNGVYRGVPIYGVGSAMTYNKALCDAAGVTKYPDTYDELMVAGTKLKKSGYPVGWCLGHTIGDGCFPNYPLLWSFGAAETDEKGKVAINSKETRTALNWMREFWLAGCDESGMAWSDSSNNQAFLGETISCTLNAASIYVKARADGNNKLADNIRHTVATARPHGRYELIQPFNHHIPAYSKNVKLGKEWLTFLGEKPQYERLFVAGRGFAQANSPEWDNHPMWKTDPQLEPFRDLPKYGRNMGWKGPFGKGASEVQAKYIIPDMIARAIKDGTESAVAWAEKEMKLIYENQA